MTDDQGTSSLYNVCKNGLPLMDEPTSLVLKRDHLAARTGQPPQGTGHLDLEKRTYLPLTPSWEKSLDEGRVV